MATIPIRFSHIFCSKCRPVLYPERFLVWERASIISFPNMIHARSQPVVVTSTNSPKTGRPARLQLSKAATIQEFPGFRECPTPPHSSTGTRGQQAVGLEGAHPL